MSENLSFTQELRKLGLIADVDTNTTNNTNTEKTVTNKPDTEKVEYKPSTRKTENNTVSKDKPEKRSFSFNDSLVYVGKKPAMNYVLTINTKMSEGLDKVTIKSRGKTISKAVDVAEIVTNRFITDANDDEVKLSTEEIFRDDGTSTNVSTIEIVIQRN